ncbi:GH3 auxin-responsive promoter family protein [Schleiferiaceae bacterium]|nr:hypothetical protein [Flavobacteriales bacterium]MDC1022078.1 GH3 auxin-responsive promoter family protein [Schleiferiaceae bacterium]
MFYSLVNKILQSTLRKYVERLFDLNDRPIETQEEILLDFISEAKDTKFGQLHHFHSIETFTDYVAHVPLHEYEDLKPYIDQMRQGAKDILWPGKVEWYAKSSGTSSGTSKYIPVPEESLEGAHLNGGRIELALYFNHNPDSKLFEGLGLRLGGSTELETHGESHSGDLSAILIQNMPIWAEFRSAPSNNTALMSNWEQKIDAILDEVISQNITSFWGVSSWFLVLFNKVIERTGASNLLEVWPNLELFAHGGVNFAPYQEQFRALMPGNQVTFMENYNASEGFFAVQDDPDFDGLLLLTCCGTFYEFIPMNEFKGKNSKTIMLDDVQLNQEYAVVISTNGGLWRYLLGDTIRFVSLKPFKIKVSGRTSHFINAFGEEVIVCNAEEALTNACAMHECSVKDFHAAPIFMEAHKSGAHQWLIEFEKAPQDLNLFSSDLDNMLQQLNSDYAAKRKGDLILGPPEVIQVHEGLFYTWLKKKNKLGGQNKIPRLSNERKLIKEFIELNEVLHVAQAQRSKD